MAAKHVFWDYQYPKKGITNAFVLDEEGRVVVIAQIGGKPSGHTARGVGIGSSYSDVVRVYGFPDEHKRGNIVGGATGIDMLDVSYEESHGVGFIFLNRKLRGYPKYTGQGPWCVGVLVEAAE
jgi:hypothetical protein